MDPIWSAKNVCRKNVKKDRVFLKLTIYTRLSSFLKLSFITYSKKTEKEMKTHFQN